jgi:hypothetical protein
MRLSLIKNAENEQGDRLLAREARWLRELENVPGLEGQIPRLLEEGVRDDGHRFLILGLPQAASLAKAGETRALTNHHEQFLARLGKARFRASDFELSGCGEWLQRSLAGLEAFAARRQLETLRGAYHDCETALLYWTGPYVVSQGDFAPWNIRTLGSQLFVSDWGHARTDASPLDDVLHYVMIQRALHARPVTARFLQSAMKRARGFAVRAYPDWSWRPQVIGALTLVYLLGSVLHRALQSRQLNPADPVVRAYWAMLEKRSAWMPA